jgi:hypothetical protein
LPLAVQLTCTFVRKEFVDGTNWFDARNLYRDFGARQRLWQFGLNPSDVAGLLGGYGWDERQQSYLRNNRPRRDSLASAGPWNRLERSTATALIG